MQEIRLERSQYQCVISPYAAPVAHVRDGETAVFYTEDAFWGRSHFLRIWTPTAQYIFQPSGRPGLCRGGASGRCPQISILDITPTRDTAVSCIHREFGALQYNRRVKF